MAIIIIVTIIICHYLDKGSSYPKIMKLETMKSTLIYKYMSQ